MRQNDPYEAPDEAYAQGEISRVTRFLASRFSLAFHRLAAEPPFRLLTRSAVKYFSRRVRTRAKWDVAERPHYLLGVLRASDQAKESGVSEISVAEFGVAGGAGLLCLQEYAEQVERETGVRIRVYGFDTGAGLPELSGDYRDHPEIWSPGDYPMDQRALERRLSQRAELVLGNIRDTVPAFVRDRLRAPIGFVAIDVDLYTSTRDVLRILSLSERRTLIRVVIYLDDAETMLYHRFAGELLAVEEFNEINRDVKIDRWRGIKRHRPFPEHSWLEKMYVAYDLRAMSEIDTANRKQQFLDLSDLAG